MLQNNHKLSFDVRFSNDYTKLNKGNSSLGKNSLNYGFSLLVGYSL